MPNFIGRTPTPTAEEHAEYLLALDQARQNDKARAEAAAASPPAPRAPQPQPTYAAGASHSACVAFLDAGSADKWMTAQYKAQQAATDGVQDGLAGESIATAARQGDGVYADPGASETAKTELPEDYLTRWSVPADDILDETGLTPNNTRADARIESHSSSRDRSGIEILYADLIAELAHACAAMSDASAAWRLLTGGLEDRFPDDKPTAYALRRVIWARRKVLRKVQKALR